MEEIKNIPATAAAALATEAPAVKKTLSILDEARPATYVPKKGKKAVLSLKDFSNEDLFAELKRRGFSGNLTINKTIVI